MIAIRNAPQRAAIAPYNPGHGFDSPNHLGGRNRHQHHRFGGFFMFASWLDQRSGHVGRLRACRFLSAGLSTRIAPATTFDSVATGFHSLHLGICHV